MKKITAHALIATIALSMSVVAFAETEGAAMKKPQPIKAVMDARKEVRGEIQQKKGEARDGRMMLASTTKEKRGEIEDLREKMASTTKGIRGEMMEKRAENVLQEMNKKFEETIKREEAIMAKVNARIEKIKTAGGNTTEAEKLVASAKMHFDEAKTALANLQTQASTVTATSTSAIAKNTIQALRKGTEEVKKHLQEGHVDLEHAVGSLRGSSQMEKATTTKSN